MSLFVIKPLSSQSIYSKTCLDLTPPADTSPVITFLRMASIWISTSMHLCITLLNISLVSKPISWVYCLFSSSSLYLMSIGSKALDSSQYPNLPSWSESYLWKNSDTSDGSIWIGSRSSPNKNSSNVILCWADLANNWKAPKREKSRW